MKTTRYGIDPDSITVEVRMAALAKEGFTAESFGITDSQLRHDLDPCRHRELRELIKQDPIGRGRLSEFLPGQRPGPGGNNHAGVKVEDISTLNGPGPQVDPDQINEAIIRGLAGVRTEDRLALDFVERHGLGLRYVAAWGQWLEWTGANWEPEKTLKTYDLARKICRKAASETDTSGEKKMLSKGKTVSAVEQLARSDRRVASVVDQWDSNHLLFNTPSGDNDNER